MLERIEWKKVPIRLALVVGQEQRIEFPASVKVGVPRSVQGLLRTQSVNGTIYLLAHAAFETNRLMVRELNSGRIYLFDVTPPRMVLPPILFKSMLLTNVAPMILMRVKMIRVQANPTIFN